MSDEQLQQRIRYLVEHGGLYDDPLSEVRLLARVAVGLGAGALLVHVVGLIV